MQQNACEVHYCAGDRHPFPLVPAIVHWSTSETSPDIPDPSVGNGYRYYCNGGKLSMDLPLCGSICHKD